MKFVPLDGKKQPDFNQRVIISFEDGSWAEAWLESVTEDQGGKMYKFKGTDDNETEHNNATHFLLIEPPKNNQ